MTSEPSISVVHGLSTYAPDLLYDVVFVRRDTNGKELYSFNFEEIQRTVTIKWEEITVPVAAGQAGQGIYQISGDLILFQNDSRTVNYTQQHLGRALEIHVLYMNGASVSSAYVNGGLRKPLPGSPYDYISNRFNLIEPYRNDMGVYLRVTDEGNARELHLTISGATAEKINAQGSIQDFYNRFATLNKPSSPQAIVNTNTFK